VHFTLGSGSLPYLSLKWFFYAWSSLSGRSEKREVTPQELAEELERHLAGNEGPYDWRATTSVELTDERLNRLIPRLIEYGRLDTAEKRQQFREIIETLRRGEIPD
jgi:hypothetical protein